MKTKLLKLITSLTIGRWLRNISSNFTEYERNHTGLIKSLDSVNKLAVINFIVEITFENMTI